MKKVLISILAILSLLSVPTALAASSYASGENVDIVKNFSDDLYVSAGNGRIMQNIDGDLYVMGGNVEINGDVSQDLVVVGGWVIVRGDIGDDLRMLGGNVSVQGKVGDDLIVGGGMVDVVGESVVGGSLIAAAGTLLVDGEIKESINGFVGSFILNGEVRNNVTLTVEDSMNISPEAKIGGNFSYAALLKGIIPDGVVQGKVNFNKFEEQIEESALQGITYLFWVKKAFSLVAMLILAALLLAFMPKYIWKGAEMTKEQPMKSLGIGMVTMILSIVGAMLLSLTIVGIPLALIILGCLIIVFYIARIFAAAWIASYIFDFKKTKKYVSLKMFGAVLIGLIIYYAVGLIPYLIGWVISTLVFLVGVGSLIQSEMQVVKYLKDKKML